MNNPYFDINERGYRILAEEADHGDAQITISKDEQVVRSFKWPAYKVWNISAHARDIVDGLEAKSDSGLYEAGLTGFGGNVYCADTAGGTE